jgi:hypothetical protein
LEKTNNAVIQAKSKKKESPAGEKKMEAPNSNDEKNLLQACSSASSASSSSSGSSSSDDSSTSSSSSSAEESGAAKKMASSPENSHGLTNNKETLEKSNSPKVQHGPRNKKNIDDSSDDERSPLPEINTASASSSSADEDDDDDDDERDDMPQEEQQVNTLVPRKKSQESSSSKQGNASNDTGTITSLDAVDVASVGHDVADVRSKNDISKPRSTEKDGTPGTAKSKRDSTRTRIILPRGEGREKVEVMLDPRRNSKAWRPKSHIATKAEGFDLLGTVQVDKWDDTEVDDDATKAISRQARPAIVRQMQKVESSKKRKMYLDKWDTMLDQGKQKKVKAKKEEWETPARNIQFQQIQAGIQSMNRGRAKGYHRQRQEAKGHHRQEAKGYHRQEKRKQRTTKP